MKDRRRLKFCFQEHVAVEAIHRRWSGRERATALAIYQAMTYLASVRHKLGGRDGFPAGRAEIAEAAGSKPATVDTYTRVFEDELGLVRRERKYDEHGRDLPSEWALETPSEQASGGDSSAPLQGVPEEEHRGSPSAPEEAHPPTTRAQDTSEDVDSRPSEPSSTSPSGDVEGSDVGGGRLVLDTFGAENDQHALRVEQRALVDHVRTLLDLPSGQPTIEAVEEAIDSFPDRDHVAVAERCAHWIRHQANSSERLQVAATYRTFLERAEPVEPPRPDWRAWVREHLPDLEGFDAELAAQWAGRLAFGGLTPTPELVRRRLEERNRQLAA